MDVDLNEQMIQGVREVVSCSIQPYLVPRETLQKLIERFVMPSRDETPEAIDTSQDIAEQVGRLFIERWSQHNVWKARIAVFSNVVWVRYANKARTFDHVVSADPPQPSS